MGTGGKEGGTVLGGERKKGAIKKSTQEGRDSARVGDKMRSKSDARRMPSWDGMLDSESLGSWNATQGRREKRKG